MKDQGGENGPEGGERLFQPETSHGDSSPTPRPSPLAPYASSLIFLALWLMLLLGGRSSMLRDSGSFWHVAAGEKMLRERQVVRVDSFSFTCAGCAWTNDYWLAECGMAALHRLAGWDGLLLATATLLAAVYAWIASRLLRAGLHILPALLLVAVAMLCGEPQFHVRPLIATIGLLAVCFAWLIDVESGAGRRRQLWWLVPIFILWTNVHGGVLAGLGTVGLGVAGWCLVAAWGLCKASGADSAAAAAAPVAGGLQSPGSGPFFGFHILQWPLRVGRKHGPNPFALDFAIIQRPSPAGAASSNPPSCWPRWPPQRW